VKVNRTARHMGAASAVYRVTVKGIRAIMLAMTAQWQPWTMMNAAIKK
jgi:hypothetical protein